MKHKEKETKKEKECKALVAQLVTYNEEEKLLKQLLHDK
jgi:hypothetical protein